MPTSQSERAHLMRCGSGDRGRLAVSGACWNDFRLTGPILKRRSFPSRHQEEAPLASKGPILLTLNTPVIASGLRTERGWGYLAGRRWVFKLKQNNEYSPMGPSGDARNVLSAQFNTEALTYRWLLMYLKRGQCGGGTVILILLNFN